MEMIRKKTYSNNRPSLEPNSSNSSSNINNNNNNNTNNNNAMIVPYGRKEENISLSERDQCLMKIENEIKYKRELLLNKRKHLKKIMNQNEFLKEVMTDYTKYYDYIIEQKKEQLIALDMLNKYIESLIQTEKLTSENIEDAKKEQQKIAHELKKIKKNLDSFLL